MKSTGVVRNLDELGRIVIPKEVRKKLEIDVKDPMEIFIEGSAIVLKKVESGCIFCNTSKNLVAFKDKLICQKCLSKLSNINTENNDKK